MDTDAFWQLIDDSRARPGDVEAHAAELTAVLSGPAPEEIGIFDRIHREQKARSCTWPLWAAGYLINGGCSDDGFEYFRDWPIAQGRVVFERAPAEPDTLARLDLGDGQDVEAEDFGGAASTAYRHTTGGDLPQHPVALPSRPLGEPWTDDDLDGLLPLLSARF